MLESRTVEISSTSKAFIPLSAREYKYEYQQLPNANLPTSIREDLGMFFNMLTDGKELPLEEHTFLVKSYQGSFSRLFGPVLKVGSNEIEGLKDDQLYIQWGPNFIPLQFTPGKVTTQEGCELDAEFGTYNFSGRGEDPAFLVSIDQGDTQVTLPITVRFSDWKNPLDSKVLNSLFKKTPNKFVEILQKINAKPKAEGSSYERIETELEFDFKELEVDRPYEVIGYYPCKTSYGISYRIFLNNFPENEQVSCGWAHSSIRPLLSTRPVISRDEPATLTLRSKDILDNGRVRIRSNLILSHLDESPESLNLDF